MKNFDEWNKVKKEIHEKTLLPDVYYHEREVWWVRLGVNIGAEQDGKGKYYERPVLVIKKHNKNCFVGMSMTTKNKDNQYYFTIELAENFVSVILSQIRLLDSKRLVNLIGTISQSDFEEIKKVASKTNFD